MKYLKLATKIANEKYDGNYTLLKFTTHYRFCFGSISPIDYIDYYKNIGHMAKGKTIEEAIKIAIEKGIDEEYIQKCREADLARGDIF